MTARLASRRILVTRPPPAGDELVRLLEAEGASVIHAPAIRVHLLQPPGRRDALAECDRLLITSRHGLEGLLAGEPAPPASRPAYAVGRTTARLCHERGLAPRVIAPHGGLAELVRRILTEDDVSGLHILWPRGQLSTDDEIAPLREHGATVKTLTVYETLDAYAEGGLPAPGELATLDTIVLASPSAVASLTAALPPEPRAHLLRNALAAVIGATTAKAAHHHGWRHVATASEPSNAALLRSL